MARQFKPVRFFVLMGLAAFLVCGVTVFYTHRAAHGRTAEERAAYEIGDRRASAARRKVANGRGVEHDGTNLFQPARVWRSAPKCLASRRAAGSEAGVRKGVHGGIQENASPAVNRNSLVIFRTILWIGLVAGTLDITENLVFSQLRGVTPWRVFQYIASGLLGTQAFQSGWASVLLGVTLHNTIALIWTGVFYVVARKFALVMRRPVLYGLLYGGVVFCS